MGTNRSAIAQSSAPARTVTRKRLAKRLAESIRVQLQTLAEQCNALGVGRHADDALASIDMQIDKLETE